MSVQRVVSITAVILIIVTLLGYVWSLNNWALGQETDIRRNNDGATNILGQLFPKLRELGQVRELSVTDQQRVLNTIFGDGGRASNSAIFQMITEDNERTDTTIHRQMAQIIEAERNAFRNAQTIVISVCTPYLKRLKTPIDGAILSWLGYPDKHIEEGEQPIKKLCKPIISTHAREAERTRTDNGIDLM